MKRTLFFVSLLIILSCKLSGQCWPVIFDEHFLEALYSLGLDKNDDGMISAEEAENTRKLDLSNLGINDLFGICIFQNLDTLICNYNKLTYLDISDLSNLKYLDLGGNSLQEIDLTSLRSLVYLDCSGNPVTELILNNNDSLKYLLLSDMPGLKNVCVPAGQFPPEGMVLDTAGSPGVFFNMYCECIGDRFEGNDEQTSAKDLEYNTYYTDLYVSVGDDDWYLLPPDEESVFMTGFLTCRYDPSEGAIHFDLINSDGQLLASSSSGTGVDGIRFATAMESPLYLHIYLDSGRVIPYSLKVDNRLGKNINTRLSLCNKAGICRDIAVSPALGDTILSLDTLLIGLMSGDRDSLAFSITNKGPDPYMFSTGLCCNDLRDDRNFALKFSGQGEFVRVFRNPFLDITGEISLEAWICPAATEAEYQGIVSKGWNGYGYELYLSGPDSARKAGFRCDAGDVMSQCYLENDRWYHVAATYDGQYLRFYVNGELNGQRAASRAIRVVAEDLYIGSSTFRSESRGFFCGSLDEVRIWNRVRKASMIKTCMNRDLSGRDPGMIGYWNINEGSGLGLIDRTSTCMANIYGDIERIISGAQVARMVGVAPFFNVIPVGSSNEISLTFFADNLSGGVYRMNIDFFSGDMTTPDFRIPVKMQITDAPSFVVSVDTLNFREIDIFSTCDTVVTVTNNGSQTLVIDSIRTDLIGSRVTPYGRTIRPGETNSFQVSLFLRNTMSVTGDIIFFTNDPTDPEPRITFTARGGPIQDKALLMSVNDTLMKGDSITRTMFFMNTSGSNDMILYPFVKYYTLPGTSNDKILVPYTGSWVKLPVGDSVVLPPLGAWVLEFTLDALSLDTGTYYADYDLPWYNPCHTNAFIPITLHVIENSSVNLNYLVPATSGLQIYPNPTDGQVTFELDQSGIWEVWITDMNGRVVDKFHTDRQICRVDLSDHPPGIYFVTLVLEGKVLTGKIVKY